MSLLYLLVVVVLVVLGVVRTKEFRATAREKLSGKWGKSICIILAYLLIALLLGIVTGLFGESALGVILSIAVSIIQIPLTYGFTTSFIKLYNDEEVKAFDFLSSGFSNFGRAWAVTLRTLLKMILPLILFIVAICLMAGSLAFSVVSTASSIISGGSSSGGLGLLVVGFILYLVSIVWLIIKSFSYAMVNYVAIDSPELSTKEAVDKSKEIMTGNRAKLFWLELSFGGWAILAAIPLCLGYLWLIPYVQFATIAFYNFVAKKDDNVVVQETPENPTETLE